MRTMLALVLTAAMVAPLYAQRPQRGQGGRGGAGMFGPPTGARLLASEDVQKDLKLTDEQKTKLKDFQTKQQEAMRELFSGGERPDREKMQEIMKKNQAESAKFVKDTLTADQDKRLKQIGYQVGGIAVFSTPDAQSELKLTDEQKEKIKAINDQMRKDMADLRGGGGGGGGGRRPMINPETQKKIEALNKEAMEKVQDALTADQKKTWETMKGPKFEGKLGAPGGGRRRGAGGAGGR